MLAPTIPIFRISSIEAFVTVQYVARILAVIVDLFAAASVGEQSSAYLWVMTLQEQCLGIVM